MRSFRSLCDRLLITLCLGACAAAHAQKATLPPLESFFENAAFGGALLSPSGRYLAARSGAPGRRDFLVVVDLTANTIKQVAAYRDSDIGRFQWVNDERLVYDVTDKLTGPGDTRYAPGLFAVNRDGSGKLQLVERNATLVSSGGRALLPWHTYMLDQRGAQDSEYIYVLSQTVNYEAGRMEDVRLLRLNTLTGKAEGVKRPGTVEAWMLDHKGEPRLALSSEDDTNTIHYRDPASNEWRVLARSNAFKPGAGAIVPIGFGPDGTLYVSTHGNRDTSALHTFNFATGKVNPSSVIVTPGYDFSGRLVSTSQKLLGVSYETDARSTVWFDQDMKALQEKVDAALPVTVNLLSVPARAETPWVLVQSYSDVVPHMFTLFNTKTGQVNKIADSRPGIDHQRAARQDMIRYKARDGLEIPAVLTLPRDGEARNLPLVVLVHGGPFVRGTAWGWRPDTQFLASRGYAVLEPEYRGSTGYGAKHFMAGWKQWGLAMQDDIADGARWAVAQGIADGRRMCIAGASYGGYATLMGLVKDPDLYKCGINWVGVTDINLMYEGTWYANDDISEEYKKYGMPVLVGDKVKDAAQLKATSPIEQATRITQPLLLAYGGVDRRVPLYHGKKFYEAVIKTNKNVEWIEYPDEGHGWQRQENRIDFWRRVEQFLDKHIGKR